jgi:hypothetical protein
MSDKQERHGVDVETAAPQEDVSAPDTGVTRASRSPRHSWMERRAGYCADTAWAWQRARFLCAKPE